MTSSRGTLTLADPPSSTKKNLLIAAGSISIVVLAFSVFSTIMFSFQQCLSSTDPAATTVVMVGVIVAAAVVVILLLLALLL